MSNGFQVIVLMIVGITCTFIAFASAVLRACALMATNAVGAGIYLCLGFIWFCLLDWYLGFYDHMLNDESED